MVITTTEPLKSVCGPFDPLLSRPRRVSFSRKDPEEWESWRISSGASGSFISVSPLGSVRIYAKSKKRVEQNRKTRMEKIKAENWERSGEGRRSKQFLDRVGNSWSESLREDTRERGRCDLNAMASGLYKLDKLSSGWRNFIEVVDGGGLMKV